MTENEALFLLYIQQLNEENKETVKKEIKRLLDERDG